MQSDIVEKLGRHLSGGLRREADAVYLFIEIAKYLEQNPTLEYPLLLFYRNWIAHSYIQRTALAGALPSELNRGIELIRNGGIDGGTGVVRDVLSMKRLRAELARFLDKLRLPADVTSSEEEWHLFLRLLIGALADVPLFFRGFRYIWTLQFTETKQGPSYGNTVARWRISGPGYVLEENFAETASE